MRIVTANGKKTVKMSKTEWAEIGKKAGWMKMAQAPEGWDASNQEPSGSTTTQSSGVEDKSFELMKKQYFDKAKELFSSPEYLQNYTVSKSHEIKNMLQDFVMKNTEYMKVNPKAIARNEIRELLMQLENAAANEAYSEFKANKANRGNI